jgi:phosphoenolpyruvate synthase/pyruvate phosphate dikinase
MDIIDFVLDNKGVVQKIEPADAAMNIIPIIKKLVDGYSIYLGDKTCGTIEIDEEFNHLDIYYDIEIEGEKEFHDTHLRLDEFLKS